MSSKLLRQGIINIIFLYIGAFLGFFNLILKAKVLTPEEIGVIAIITSISTIIGYIISFGIPNGLRKYYHLFRENKKQKTGFIIFCLFSPLLNFLVLSVLFFIVRKYVLALYDNQLLESYFSYIYWFFLGNHLVTVFQYLFESEYMSVIANIYYDFIWRVIHLCFLTVMLAFSVGFFPYFIFTLISLASRIVIYIVFFYIKIDYSVKPSFAFLEKNFIAEFYRFAFYNFFSSMTGIITCTIDKLMIGAMLAVSDTGIYTIVAQLVMFIRMISYAFNRIAHPLIAEYWGKNEIEKISSLFKINSNSQLFLGSFVFLIIVSYPSQILSVAGKEYSAQGMLMILLAFGYLFDTATGGISNAIISYSSYYRYDLVCRFFQITATIATNLVFIPLWGLNGAAFASAVSIILYNILKVILIWIKSGIHPYNINTAKVYALLLLMILAVKVFDRFKHVTDIFAVAVVSVMAAMVYIFLSVSVFRIDFVIDFIDKIIAKLGLWKK